MRFFNKHIAPKIILYILLCLAIFGTISILLTVNRMNTLFNTDLGFNKDSVNTILTHDSKVILNDSLVFSSDLPGFPVKNTIEVISENISENVMLAHQFISNTYFAFFNYTILCEDPNLYINHGEANLVYINESAVKELGIYNIDGVVGTKILTSNNHEFIVCGVVKDFGNLCLNPRSQAKIYELNNEHLNYAFYDKTLLNIKDSENIIASGTISFHSRLQNRYKIIEDAIYSAFFFINLIILLVGIGFIGNKYTAKREKELFKILGIGIHILTLVISQTYIYLIAIFGFVVSPLAIIIQKLWLSLFENRINFGLVDLFIILSISLLTIYLVCCPKKKLEKQLKEKSINVI
jgi:hypothetical protein